MNSNILGRGSSAYVVYPSLDGTKGMVSKISSRWYLEGELRNIHLLPDIGPYKIDKNAEIRKLPYYNHDVDACYMNIPFIDGNTLESYFDELRLFTGSLNELHHHLVLLFALRDEIKKMNALGVKHGDIKLDNIMYSKADDRMYLVDFGLTCLIDEEDYDDGQDDDIIWFDSEIIETYVRSLINTDDGRKWILVNGVCQFSSKVEDFDVFSYNFDFIESVNYFQVNALTYHPNSENIINEVKELLKTTPTYERDEKIHSKLWFPYRRPMFEVDVLDVEKLKNSLNL